VWKTIFDIFGSKYTGEEFIRRENTIYFNLVKKVFLQGSRAKLHAALMSQQMIIKVYRNEEVGSVVLPLQQLCANEEV
jgi:hypothetical protein